MGKRNKPLTQNLDADIPLKVTDAHHHKYFIRAMDILRLDVTDHTVTATFKKTFPPSPVFIPGSLTALLCKLPYNYFIQVRDNCAVHTDFIYAIDGCCVSLHDKEVVDFSRHYYHLFNQRA